MSLVVVIEVVRGKVVLQLLGEFAPEIFDDFRDAIAAEMNRIAAVLA